MKRRWAEVGVGDSGVRWAAVFRGKGADIGCGPDKIPLPDCAGFDIKDGDANKLSEYVAKDSLDYIHSSQSLEHMTDPVAAVHEWLKCIKPGGYLVVTVPSWELYESMRWPSKHNPDHRSTFSLWQKGSPSPHHCKMPEWLYQFNCEILVCRLVDTNFDYSEGMLNRDQTWDEKACVECWIEFGLRKPNERKAMQKVLSGAPAEGVS